MEAKHLSEPMLELALHPDFREHERALLSALLQATDYGILLSGLDRQDIVANRRLGELFGMMPQEVVQTSPEALRQNLRPQLANMQAFEQKLEETYADPELSYEDEIVLQTRPPRILRRFTAPVRNAAGEPVARLWTFLDITENRHLQQEVEAQLAARTCDLGATSAILQGMNDLCRGAVRRQTEDHLLFTTLDTVRRALRADNGAILLRALEEDGWKGVGCSVGGTRRQIRLPMQEEPMLAMLAGEAARRTSDEEPFLMPARGVIKRLLSGKAFHVLPLRHEEEVVGLLLVGAPADDLADSLPAPFRMAHLRSLGDQVALTLRTHRLQSELRTALEGLQAAQNRLVEIEKLRTAGTLAASIAHDIRNILAPLQIEIAALPQAASEGFNAQFQRFSALTQRLLAFARPDILDTRPTSLADVLDRVCMLLEAQAQINAVAFTREVEASLPPVAADATQLERAFLNLALNAIQAMTQVGGTLVFRATLQGQWVQVTVQDNGPGIPTEALPKLFDPFFTTRANGTGLGLYSARRIIEEHGGTISVHSQPQEGTTFTILLPIQPEEP